MKHNFKELDDTSNDKVKLFSENIVVIEEEWFDDMNLTDGATFPAALIKCAQYIFKKKSFHVTKSDACRKLQ